MLKLKVRLNTHFTLYFLLLALCSTLTACGTKGPLYIPEQRYPQGVEQDTSDQNQEKAPAIPPVVTPPTVKDY